MISGKSNRQLLTSSWTIFSVVDDFPRRILVQWSNTPFFQSNVMINVHHGAFVANRFHHIDYVKASTENEKKTKMKSKRIEAIFELHLRVTLEDVVQVQ